MVVLADVRIYIVNGEENTEDTKVGHGVAREHLLTHLLLLHSSSVLCWSGRVATIQFIHSHMCTVLRGFSENFGKSSGYVL